MREALKTAHPLIQIGVLILSGFGAMFVLIFITAMVFMGAGVGLEVLSDPQMFTDPNSMGVMALKVLQIMQSIGLFIIPYILYRVIIGDKGYALLSVSGRFGMLAVFCATMVASLPMINFLAEWNSALHLPEALSGIEDWMRSTEKEAERLITTFLTMDSVGDLVFNLFMIALLPAVAEEVFFRGTMQPLLLKTVKSHHLAIWLTAFLFSFFHMQFLGFLPRLLLGAVFGYAAHWSGSLLLPMAGHLLNNGVAVLITWYIGAEAINDQLETFGANKGEGAFTLLSFIVVAAGMTAIYFSSKRFMKKAPVAKTTEA